MVSYTLEEYKNSYYELVELFKHINKLVVMRIPYDILKYYKDNALSNNSFKYDESVELDEQKISHLTKILYANLYINYIAENEEREKLLEEDKLELKRIEEKKRKKYNIDDIFKNNDEKIISNDIMEKKIDEKNSNSLVTISKKDNFVKKIINKLKALFK